MRAIDDVVLVCGPGDAARAVRVGGHSWAKQNRCGRNPGEGMPVLPGIVSAFLRFLPVLEFVTDVRAFQTFLEIPESPTTSGYPPKLLSIQPYSGTHGPRRNKCVGRHQTDCACRPRRQVVRDAFRLRLASL